MTTEMHEGGCLCGAVRYRVIGDRYLAGIRRGTSLGSAVRAKADRRTLESRELSMTERLWPGASRSERFPRAS